MCDVLWLFEFPTLNGGERSLLATLPHLQREGFRFQAIAPSQGPLADALEEAGVAVVPFVFHGTDAKRLPQDVLRQQLGAVLDQRRPSLLHANSLAMGRLCGPVTARLGVPSLAHLRDMLRLSRQAICDLNENDRLIAVSHATRDYHVAQGLQAEATHVLHNGVHLERFQPRPPSGRLHRELGLPPRARLIGSIGQLILRKGQDVLAQAALKLADEYDDIHLVFVGERYSEKAEAIRYVEDLRNVFRATSMADRVHFLGERDDVASLMNEFTLLVHSARQEPLGRVLLEAAASGVAVVASDVGGTREIFPPAEQAARLVPPDDPSALAAAMHELLCDPAERQRMQAAARCRAEAAFDISIAAGGLARHYQQVRDGVSQHRSLAGPG